MARIDTLPVVPFPLPDPAIVLQDLWITQGGRDFSISPVRLGAIQQSGPPPINPFEYQLWWDTSTLPTSPAMLKVWRHGIWAELGPFADQNGNFTIPGTLTVNSGVINGADANGFLEIGSKLQVNGGVIAGPAAGPISTTSDFTVGRNLITDGTTTLKGATTVTGGLTSDTLTTSGNATVGGNLTTKDLTSTGTVTGNNANFSGFVTVNGTLTSTGGTTSGAASTFNGPAPQITLNNGTSNWIQWGNAGVNPPTISSHSPGTKLLISATASPTSYDTAIGYQIGAMWFASPSFAFYGVNGAAATMSVDANGDLSITTPTLTTSSALTCNGTLTINNAGLLIADGNINSGTGTLNTAGSFSATGTISAVTINASGQVQGENLRSVGDSYIGNSLFVTANANLNVLNCQSGSVGATTLTVSGSTNLNALNSQSANVAGNLGVGNQFTATGLVDANGGLDVSGVVPDGGGAALYVNGLTQVQGDLNVNATLRVSGLSSVFNQGLVVNAASGHLVALQVGGDLQVFGDGFANSWQINPSARASKRDVADFGRGFAAIKALRPISYRLEQSPRRLHGLIAEEVEAALPEAVGQSDKAASKTIDVMVLIATLINGMRELGEKIDELERVQGSPR